jgi:antitoxin YefM
MHPDAERIQADLGSLRDDGEVVELTETAHLLRSPKNAERLLKTLERAKSGMGKPETVDELRRDLGLESEE